MKANLKKTLALLSLCLAASAAGAGSAIIANAENNAAEVDAPFSTYGLVDGASVRYATEDGVGMGFSYAVKMDQSAYEALQGDTDYTNVKYGILIAPNSYYKAHPFNTQENIDAYYSLNEEAAGKAFLYDLNTTALSSWDNGEENTVYFRGSLTDIKEKNLKLDYRGVGYVEYTVGGVTEKHFFTDDVKSVRCPVEIAEYAVAALDETADADKISALNTNYITPAIENTDWTVTKTTDSAYKRWVQQWGAYVLGTTSNSPAVEIQWAEKGNRWVDSKYTTTFTMNNGDTSIEYVSGKTNVQNLQGKWTLKGKTICSVVANSETESYERNIFFDKFLASNAKLTINDAELTPDGNSLYGDAIEWSEEKNAYKIPDPPSWGYNYTYDTTATGNFVVDFTLQNGGGREEFRIYTADGKYIAFDCSDSVDTSRLYLFNQIGWFSETRIGGNESVFTNPNHNQTGALSLRVVNYNNTLYIFSNTHKDAEGNVVKSTEYKLLMSIGDTAVTYNDIEIQNNGQLADGVKDMYTAATKNEFAFAIKGNSGGDQATYVTVNLNDDDAKVATFMAAYLTPATPKE